MTEQLVLIAEPITVHCFLIARCEHVEKGYDPHEVHAAMERHYAASHRDVIAALAAGVTAR